MRHGKLSLLMAALFLAGCAAPKRPSRIDPPLPPGIKKGVPLSRVPTPKAFADPDSIHIRLVETNGLHVEYGYLLSVTGSISNYLGTNIFELSLTNLYGTNMSSDGIAAVTGVELTFPTTTNNLYLVQGRDSLNPPRVALSLNESLWGGTNEWMTGTQYITNNTGWTTLSQPIQGNGSNVVWRGNIAWRNCFFRIQHN